VISLSCVIASQRLSGGCCDIRYEYACSNDRHGVTEKLSAWLGWTCLSTGSRVPDRNLTRATSRPCTAPGFRLPDHRPRHEPPRPQPGPCICYETPTMTTMRILAGPSWKHVRAAVSRTGWMRYGWELTVGRCSNGAQSGILLQSCCCWVDARPGRGTRPTHPR
jgi:hypothetical protein